MVEHTPRLGKLDRRARVLDICAALPAIDICDEQHITFRVGRRVFAYYLDNHHGDGIVSVCCKSTLGRQRELVKRHRDRYYVPAYVGPKGWVSLRVDLPLVDWEEVANMLHAAYRLVAPRRLSLQIE